MDGFKEEREWRAVHHPQIGRSDFMKLSVEVTRRNSAARLENTSGWGGRPALEGPCAGEPCLEGGIIGPSQYPWVMAQAFGDELVKLGLLRYTVRAF